MKLTYVVKENDNYKNINEILSNEFHFSTRLNTKLIKNKKILKNNIVTDTRNSIVPSDIIIADFDYEEDNSNIVPTKMNLDIIYEDEWFIVINKPAGVAIHPSQLHYDSSLSNGIRFYFDSIGLKKKIRPVNRLDLNTSGLVILRNANIFTKSLLDKCKMTFLKKNIYVLFLGILENKSGTISLPIARKAEVL